MEMGWMYERPLYFSDVFPNYHAWSQLRSIHGLVDTVFTWSSSLLSEIKQAEQDWKHSSGDWANMAAEATAIGLYEESVYRDAAAVQSTVGVLAPFIEGFLVNAFRYLGCLHDDVNAPSEHPRWTNATSIFWNPRKPHGLIQGLRELRDALDLEAWLSDEQLDTLDLLFYFRNRSFHFAYEWPTEDIEKFEKYIKDRHWEDHVEWSKSGSSPWIPYLSDSFLSGAMVTTTEIVKGFVSVAEDRGGLFRADPSMLPGFGPGEKH